MCFFKTKSNVGQVAQAETQNAQQEKEAAKSKARLLETEGQNKGAELNASQGKTIRRIFG